MQPIAPQPGLTEQVHKVLLDEICDGGLPPGTHLVQEQIAEKLGVSRQPVQQALALLKSEGLLEELGRRGLFVAPLDLARMQHHYAIRGALDGLAARLAATAAAASADLASRLKREGQALVDAGHAAIEAGAMSRLVQRDVEFHAFVYAASGNPLLAATAEPHWWFLRRIMSEVYRHAEPPPAIWRQHAEILSAIVRGDAARAETAAVRHVEGAAGRLCAALARSEIQTATVTTPSGPSRTKIRTNRGEHHAGPAEPGADRERAGAAQSRKARRA